ncbi:MAG: putative exported protein [Naasia sp.]|nr:putative exported protein [Naasia sp.]
MPNSSYPEDRFDRPPVDLQRVGAHRTPRPAGRGWVAFAWAALATGVLVGVGVLAMFVINDRVSFSNPGGGAAPPASEPHVPPVQPTVDPTVNVVLLNGTDVAGLAARAGDLLTTQGWAVGARSNATGTDVQSTVVFYTDASQEGAALGIAQALGAVETQLSDRFVVEGENRITVVLGADYAGPA